MTEEQLTAIEARADAATKGPWRVWDGHAFVGGGADLCIGSGDAWIANMDHRYSEAHLAGQCMAKDSVDICSLSDAESITKEQRDTADFIAAARMDVPELVAEIRILREGIAAQAQKVHQSYHAIGYGGTWETCPKDVCASARTYLQPS